MSGRVLAVAVVVAIGSGAWLTLGLGDLSTVDGSGEVLEGGSEAHNLPIAAAIVLTGLAAGGVAAIRPGTRWAVAVAAVVTPVFWYSWRAAAAEVVGANLWPIGLVFAVLPGAVVAGVGGAVLGAALGRRRLRSQN